ncbi:MULTISPECIES: P-loop NTPase [unclassified Halomonas]|uniref:P-loop NTPase n=1 Tax=unclassified Halomonas TaxID=2609666 RepID=UPI002884FB5F|nr:MULTISPECIES: P-loop NTPase [unclassified Halomonas]MDT0500453.1 P-loop NTPase [Halomonas sp. PAR7]MDT0511651.1 P-loop NTPase [Halomonas sp. LES1]MDT0590061.1 P-loop NTPase [Halomonas sp. PAR8]
MSVSHFPSHDPLALAPEECGRGHACQFCPDEATCRLEKGHHEKQLLESRLARIGQIIMVMANKGGVGKSTVSANVAAGLAARGYRVGIADADIHGPNQSRFFGFVGERVRIDKRGLGPRAFRTEGIDHPIQVGSLAFMMESDDTPIVWRDAYKHDFMHHLIGSFDWGPLDFLVIDMPPGTGNELITLADLLEGHDVAALLATTPQEVALMDSLKAVRFCQERGMPLLGVVENMAGVTCPHCGGEFHLFPRAHLAAALAEVGVDSLAQIPLSPALASGSDAGRPIVLDDPQGAEARAFMPAVEACIAHASETFAAAAVDSLQALSQHPSMSDELSGDLEAALASVPDDQRDALRAELDALLGAGGTTSSDNGDASR